MKKLLNESGLKKLIPYLEAELPGIKGKLSISGDKLKFNEFEFYVVVPIAEEMTPPGVPPPAPPGTPTVAGIENDPQAQKMPNQTEKPIGKNKNTQVKQVGRSGIEREKEQEFQKMTQKLKTVFPTRAELDKFIKGLENKNGEDVISQLAQALQVSR